MQGGGEDQALRLKARPKVLDIVHLGPPSWARTGLQLNSSPSCDLRHQDLPDSDKPKANQLGKALLSSFDNIILKGLTRYSIPSEAFSESTENK